MITGARIRATLFCVLAIIMQASAADPGLGDVMAALSAIRLSESKYTEEKHYEMMDLPMIQQGVLRYESPEKLAWERGDNGQGRYEIHENQLITRRHDKVEIISLESMPALRAFIESFRATLAGNEQRLRQYYVVTFSGMVESWKLQLQPRDRTMRRFIDQIIIQGEKDQLRMIEIYEMNGDWSRMKLEPVRQEYHAG
jgi:hypothetical protein